MTAYRVTLVKTGLRLNGKLAGSVVTEVILMLPLRGAPRAGNPPVRLAMPAPSEIVAKVTVMPPTTPGGVSASSGWLVFVIAPTKVTWKTSRNMFEDGSRTTDTRPPMPPMVDKAFSAFWRTGAGEPPGG